MNHASLFSGIGGFDLAAEWMGWTNVFNCEWEDFPRRVLKHHFPNAAQYGDIRELRATAYAGGIDILTGGFPCQPYSVSGKQKGKHDERHLWPEMLRVIQECSPRYVVGENVFGLVGWNDGLVFEEVCADLEAEGYDVQPFVLPATGVDAPHKRYRVWFVAYSNSAPTEHKIQARRNMFASHDCATANTMRTRTRQNNGFRNTGQFNKESKIRNWENWPTVAPLCGGDDGLPKKLDGITFPKWRKGSIKAYGNAIVPQVALQIFKAIEAYERQILL